MYFSFGNFNLKNYVLIVGFQSIMTFVESSLKAFAKLEFTTLKELILKNAEKILLQEIPYHIWNRKEDWLNL